ncbi:MAG: UDP-N-acetylmuramate dehydrogenase [Clostridia bacterium]|nr:UDP-N-acetylmuramate dehydrogenase [Clostridia bacterium]
MSRHTTFRTGGPADLMLLPSSLQELRETLSLLRSEGVKPFILGNGSNLLVSDKGIRGVVVKIGAGLDGMIADGDRVICGSGAFLTRLCGFAAENSLTGAEALYGIPGTVGGAVYMNAGAYGSEIKDILVSADYIESDGTFGTLHGTEGYGYRRSPFTDGDRIITSAVFAFKRGDRAKIEAKMEDIKSRRAEKQPLNFPSAGSVFKRPEGYFAAALIEQSGLKGTTVGGAQVSEKHAGFIVNTGGATTGDILSLIDIVREKVLKDSGVLLETEVRFIGEE